MKHFVVVLGRILPSHSIHVLLRCLLKVSKTMFRLNLVWKWRCLYCFVLFPWKQLCCHPMMKSLLISWIVYDTSVIRLLHEVNHTVSFSMWLVFIAIGFIFCLFFIWCHNCNPESCIVIIVTSWICLWYVGDYAFTWSKTVSCHFLYDWCSVSVIVYFNEPVRFYTM